MRRPFTSAGFYVGINCHGDKCDTAFEAPDVVFASGKQMTFGGASGHKKKSPRIFESYVQYFCSLSGNLIRQMKFTSPQN